jgi:hypothetical protein
MPMTSAAFRHCSCTAGVSSVSSTISSFCRKSISFDVTRICAITRPSRQ